MAKAATPGGHNKRKRLSILYGYSKGHVKPMTGSLTVVRLEDTIVVI